MSEGGTLTTPRSAIADENSGASQACILGPRDRWQASTGSYTEAELWLYRDRTMGLLRRYRRISIEVGRLPSLLGREVFRTRVSSYHVTSLEEAGMFVRDGECRLQQLNEFDRKLLTRIIFQEYTHDEAAQMLGCWRRTIGRRFAEALDRRSGLLLDAGLFVRLPDATSKAQKSCQEGENIEIPVSDSEEGK